MEIWDTYGQWDKISNLHGLDTVKAKITGDKRAWRSNFVPSALEYAFGCAAQDHALTHPNMPSTVLDFGCGLGRNAPMLRKFFPRVVGFDLPEMLTRFRTETPNLYWKLYDKAYDSLDAAINEENYSLLYDSVVFQHIINPDYFLGLLDIISPNNSLRTLVSIYSTEGHNHLKALHSRNWRIWHTETETMSFEGAAHTVTILRR